VPRVAPPAIIGGQKGGPQAIPGNLDKQTAIPVDPNGVGYDSPGSRSAPRENGYGKVIFAP